MTRIPDHILEAIRERLPLSELVGRAVVLQRRGGDLVGLCPFHNERTPSFTVNDGRGFYHCFGCGAHGDVFRWLTETDGLDFRAAVARAGEMVGIDTGEWTGPIQGHLTRAVAMSAPGAPIDPAEMAEKRRLREAERAADEARIRAYALEIWRASLLIDGTPAEAYLRGRGLHLDRWPVSLRFHPDLACRQMVPGVKEPVLVGRFPALVGAVQAPDGRIGGVWRIYLVVDSGVGALANPKPPGAPTLSVRKADQREGVSDAKLGLGRVVGGAVRLADWRAGADGQGDLLAIAEGIETALSALACGVPAWASLAASRIKRLVVPDGVQRRLLIADHDGTGLQAMLARAAEWQSQGKEVRIILPVRAGEDLNDVIRQQAAELRMARSGRAA